MPANGFDSLLISARPQFPSGTFALIDWENGRMEFSIGTIPRAILFFMRAATELFSRPCCSILATLGPSQNARRSKHQRYRCEAACPVGVAKLTSTRMIYGFDEGSIRCAGPIILASDFPIFRDSLKAYLEQETDIEIIGCANREQEMIPLLQSSEPKLVVLDLNLDWEALCALLRQIHTTCSVRSLVRADGLDSSRMTQLILHGAHGVVPSCTTRALLTKSIHTVLAGGL